MTLESRESLMAKKKPVNTDLTDQSVALAEFAEKVVVAAEQFGVKKKSIQNFPLDEAERAIAADLPGLSATLKRKLKTKIGTFSVADTASIVMALAESLLEGEPLHRLKLLFISKKLTDCLQANVVPAAPGKDKPKKSKPTDTVYQFKITLLEATPRFGEESRFRIALSTNFTNISRRRGDGPTAICICSTSRVNTMVILNCWITGSMTSIVMIPRRLTSVKSCPIPAIGSASNTITISVMDGNMRSCSRGARQLIPMPIIHPA
jgi:hypothetical protein